VYSYLSWSCRVDIVTSVPGFIVIAGHHRRPPWRDVRPELLYHLLVVAVAVAVVIDSRICSDGRGRGRSDSRG
jgi:hypothetical protein